MMDSYFDPQIALICLTVSYKTLFTVRIAGAATGRLMHASTAIYTHVALLTQL